MKFKDYVANLVELLKSNPESGELDVLTAKDSEGNGFEHVHYAPSIGHFDGDSFFGKDNFEDMELSEDTEVNAVCVN